MREDYEASFDTRDTLDARDTSIPSMNQGIGKENLTDQVRINLQTNREGSLDLLTGVMGDLAKQTDEAENEAMEDGSKTLLPGCSMESEQQEYIDEANVTQDEIVPFEKNCAAERKENEANIRNEEDVLLKSWELDRRREDIDVECVEEQLGAASAPEEVSEEEIQEAYAVIENSVSKTNRSRVEIIQAVEQLSEKLEEEDLGNEDDNITKELYGDVMENDEAVEVEKEEVVLRSRTLSGSSPPPCRLSDTFCDEIFSELSGTLDRTYPGLSTIKGHNPTAPDLANTQTFPNTNAEDLVSKLTIENRIPLQDRITSDCENQNSRLAPSLVDPSLISTSRVLDDQHLSETLSLSSSLLLNIKTPPPSPSSPPISPSPTPDHFFSQTSSEGETRSAVATLASAPLFCCSPQKCSWVAQLTYDR